MKTLFKTYDQHQILAKKKHYESLTGIKWDYWWTGEGWRIFPIASATTANVDENAATQLLPFITRDAKTLLMLKETSELPWQTVIDGAWTLCKTNKVLFHTNRNSNMISVYLPNQKYKKEN